MTDREFRRLKRIELIEIIYQLQSELEEKNKELEDRRIRIEKAGSIAEAAVAVHGLMEAAQKTADQYVASVKDEIQEEKMRMQKEAETAADEILEKAKTEAAQILAEAKQTAEQMVTTARHTIDAEAEPKNQVMDETRKTEGE